MQSALQPGVPRVLPTSFKQSLFERLVHTLHRTIRLWMVRRRRKILAVPDPKILAKSRYL